MPLFEYATALLRRQLEEIEKGNREKAIVVGKLTDAQLAEISEERTANRNPTLTALTFLIV